MHQILNLEWFLSRLAVAFAQSIEAWCSVENEDVVGAAPTGDAPTTSEWSTSLLSTKLCLILEVWLYLRTVDYVRFHADVECSFWSWSNAQGSCPLGNQFKWALAQVVSMFQTCINFIISGGVSGQSGLINLIS